MAKFEELTKEQQTKVKVIAKYNGLTVTEYMTQLHREAMIKLNTK